MRLGLVRFLNARPLDYGIRQAFPSGDLLEETPARLVAELLAGRLDGALISSVECFRHADRLDFYPGVGVCARGAVRSILFFTRRAAGDPARAELERVFVDQGSRSSVALLEILLRTNGRPLPRFEEQAPALIPDLVDAHSGGLLIGDAALNFRHDPRSLDFECRDLATWWYEREALPFVFALWAFPRERPLSADLFENSLDQGLAHLEKIAAGFPYPDALEYIRDVLHYRLDADDLRSLAVFRERLGTGVV